MMHELSWMYGCNIVINSGMAFFTTAGLMMIGIFLLRIKEPRMQALMLSIPFLKLVLDLFLYNFSAWALGHSINPLEAEPGSRIISIWLGYPSNGIQLLTSDGKTFTVADMATLSVNPIYMKMGLVCALMISAGLLTYWIFQLYRSVQHHRSLLAASAPCYRPIFNPALNYRIHKANVHVIVSTMVAVPCALGPFKKFIVFPSALVEELSQAEFEAIVAHELDHLRCYDSISRLICNLLGVLFWWIPTRWCLARMERLQEQACDRKVRIFGLPSIDLASAIFKAVKYAKHSESPMLRTCFIGRKWISRRIDAILHEGNRPANRLVRTVQYALGGIFMCLILLGKFWIF